ncbi:MAG: lipid A biosynthesis acyltransferase [Gallionellales bacterium GWA2_60_18]|nr:MAG: lipid A biosynthesis acyltransferase [Gallionellales bacterium GWA2_60_18]
MPTRLGIFILWLLHFLPLPLLARLGDALGLLLYALSTERRSVTAINLRLCFPELTETQRTVLAKQNFQSFARSFIERGILWWSAPQRIRRLVRVEGLEHLESAGGPVILLVPHFVALDVGWSWLTQRGDLVSVYSNQKNPVFHKKLLEGRLRFGGSRLYSRQQGLRPVIKAMNAGQPFYYLPDQDQGIRDGVFVPFFGVPTATLTALPRLAGMTGAKVVPLTVRMLPNGTGYELRFYPAWESYPSSDLIADTRRMNEFIEERVREMPEQYFWLHKRFKTRPKGEKKFY